MDDNKLKSEDSTEEMLAEYDFRGGVRGKYADSYQAGVLVVELEAEPELEA
jgi:hypothetical protein